MDMQRRNFLTASLIAGSTPLFTASRLSAQDEAATPNKNELLPPTIFGPAAEEITILQAVGSASSGFLEFGETKELGERVDGAIAGLIPYDKHSLKFKLPALKPGQLYHYRITVRPINFRNAYDIKAGEPLIGPIHSFRTPDPSAQESRFVVWNDTHENLNTIRALIGKTKELSPDFLVWNGDQTNDIYDPAKMANQYLCPGGMAIAADVPLAYSRGNHDVRGPAARELPRFTGTPGDRYYYAFRSGPLAALVMDTGEDKEDDHPVFGGLAAFARMRAEQTRWLEDLIEQPWFKEAPHKVLFCHIPLWWQGERANGRFGAVAGACREEWLPSLQKAGVKLVISGHTHRNALLPAGPDRPITQLVGGGPQPERATYISGHVTREKLEIRMLNLAGETLHEVSL